MNLLILGNCQAKGMAELMQAMVEHAGVAHIQLLPAEVGQLRAGKLSILDLKSDRADISTHVAECDLVLLQDGARFIRLFQQGFPHATTKFRFFPRIDFTAFHPDTIHLKNARPTPTGRLHSSIACLGWTRGLSVEETCALFREEVFEALGFFNYWDASIQFLIETGKAAVLPLENLIEGWNRRGPWMYTINHPKLFVLADLAREILTREGISFLPGVEQSMPDKLANDSVWPVYPEIGRRLAVEGNYLFMRPGVRSTSEADRQMGLDEFIRASFDAYSRSREEDFVCERLISSRYQALGSTLKAKRGRSGETSTVPVAAESRTSPKSGRNPYQGLPDYQFWRRAIERLPMREVDPVVRSRFTLKRDDKVATAGSCFAQHIARTLVKHGFNYYIAEQGDNLETEEAQRRNFGVFSARYGNLYTTRQLLQLFDRAYGTFTPADNCWTRSDGRLADPFRPQVEPDGFATIEELEQSRADLFQAVRETFENLDVFVFTLGLTEAWRSRSDGAVYPLAPGVAAGEMDEERHEFVNFSVAEVTADMQAFVDRLLSVNSQAKIILTVSPVPLIATYEDRHVLVSTTYSKSVLRVAAEEISQRNPMCAYFPSYEIITGNYARSEYFESDLRSVKQEGVDHVMRLFLAHYSSEQAGASLDQELMRENALVSEIVCDEEAIDD